MTTESTRPGWSPCTTRCAADHEIAVIAPDRNWSIAGHNKTMDRPLRVTERAWEGTARLRRDGTPSDCVSLAALGFLGYRPDLVVAGINKGPNLGDDITYSGTVAAAMEGIISEIPARSRCPSKTTWTGISRPRPPLSPAWSAKSSATACRAVCC